MYQFKDNFINSEVSKKVLKSIIEDKQINYKKLDYSRSDFEKQARVEVISDVVPTSAFIIENVIKNIPEITSVDKEFENSLMLPVAQAISVC